MSISFIKNIKEITQRNYKLQVIFGLLFSFSFLSTGQTALSLKFSPINIHPFNEPNNHLFENKIDANALFVVEPCVILGFETFVYDDALSLRFMFGGYGDAVSHPALFLQAGLKYKIFQVYRSCLAVGVGAMFHGRERWGNIETSVPVKGWATNGKWEYSIGVLGEIEYILVLAERHDLLFSVMYGLEHKTFSASIGYRFWISTNIRNPKKCGSCPFGGHSKGKKWHF
ncbi:MAG: hypothetical protein LBV69_02545 [Bacteroidales bacterium]|nr:hypothetical protein [Bacteroidales bacterium]